MSAGEKGVIITITTPAIGPWDASNFADNFLRNKAVIMPNGGGGSVISQIQRHAGTMTHMARLWENDNGIMDRATAQLQRDPALKRRFEAVMTKDLQDNGDYNEFRRQMTQFSQGKSLSTLVAESERRLGIAAPAAPTTRREPVRETTPAPTTRREPARESTPAPTTRREPVRESTPAPTTRREQAPAAPAAPAPDAASSPQMSNAESLAIGLGGTINTIYGDEFSSDVQSMIEKVRLDPALRTRLDTAIHNDPQLRGMLDGEGGSGGGIEALLERYGSMDEAGKRGVKDALRPHIRRVLDDPALIADSGFRSQMQRAAVGGGISGMLGNFDLGSLRDMPIIGPMIAAVERIFANASSDKALSFGDFMATGNYSSGFSGYIEAGMQYASNLINQDPALSRFNLDASAVRPTATVTRIDPQSGQVGDTRTVTGDPAADDQAPARREDPAIRMAERRPGVEEPRPGMGMTPDASLTSGLA